MPIASSSETPLVSVIIPCYNQGHFLAEAIESLLAQTYAAIEIIVVDDGSTDNTKETAARYKIAKYIYQENQGLSAARNKGVQHSTGEYVAFLDSDDLLYPRGIEYNVAYLQQHPDVVFTYGTYDEVNMKDQAIHEVIQQKTATHYHLLLQFNFIAMIATVLFRKSLFQEFAFDPALKNCEDYDLYLKIARKYPIGSHEHKIAAYRFHDTNMTVNIPALLDGILLVLNKHGQELTAAKELQQLQKGRSFLKKYYCGLLYSRMRRMQVQATPQALNTLLKHRPYLYFKFRAVQLLSR